jgi:hypothetical protein
MAILYDELLGILFAENGEILYDEFGAPVYAPSYSANLSTNDIGKDGISNKILSNLKMYYDWGLLNVGGWSEVDIPTIQGYGGDLSRLRAVSDPAYLDGQIWEAPRKDFVWEEIDYIDMTGGIHNPQPVGIPEINGSPATVSYDINYPLGRIVFDDPIPTDSEVRLSYSYRSVQVYLADNLPWRREVQQNSYRIDNTQFHQIGSGEWSIFGQERIQLPAIFIKMRGGNSNGVSLGSSTQYINRDIEFHILSENDYDRNNLFDIVSNQNDRKIPMFDTNRVVENNDFPLNYKGELIKTNGYAEFVSSTGYFWGICYMRNAKMIGLNHMNPSVSTAVVSTTMSIIA